MNLVDVANGKNRHVPYRDSRLTFLLQVKIQNKSRLLNTPSPHTVSIASSGSLSYFARIPWEGTLKRQLLQMSAHLFGIHLPCFYFCYLVLLTMCFTPWPIYELLYCSSSSETLSTLKFAQRAKLIQNNVPIQVYQIFNIWELFLVDLIGDSSTYSRQK